MDAALMSVTFTPRLSRWRMIQIDDDGFVPDLVNAQGQEQSITDWSCRIPTNSTRQTSARAGIMFNGLKITSRTPTVCNRVAAYLNSAVTENTRKGVANGIALGEDLLANELSQNVVEASDSA
jgi:hypothetical protein